MPGPARKILLEQCYIWGRAAGNQCPCHNVACDSATNNGIQGGRSCNETQHTVRHVGGINILAYVS